MTSIAVGQIDESKAMPARRYRPCLALLRSSYDTLTETERRVADYVLTNADEVLISSVTEVAGYSAVAPSTITRLATKLGYSGFPAMKMALAVDLLGSSQGAAATAPGAGAADVIANVFGVGSRSLSETAALLNPAQLEQAAAAIAHAGRVEVYAVGSFTRCIAEIALNRFLMLGLPAALFTQDWHQAVGASTLKAGDVAIGISHTGESGPVPNALTVANASGATTVAITATPGSAITQVAALHLLAASTGSWFLSQPATSHVAMLTIIDALYSRTVLIRNDQHNPLG